MTRRLATCAAVAVLAALGAFSAAGCGDRSDAGDSIRLRHVGKRKLVYELAMHEEAPHPDAGIGGSLDVEETVQLACLSVEPDGRGHYEASVLQLKLTAPPSAGAAVDTQLGRPVPGDRIGANNRALTMLPRTALIDLTTRADVIGAQPDPEIRTNITPWIRTQSSSAKKAIVRLADALDVGPVVHRWFGPLANILPAAERVPHGATWKSTPPDIEVPAGRLTTSIDVMYRREGDVAVLEGKGTFALTGEAPAERLVDFESGSLEMTARIDLVRGVLLSYEESGRFDLRMHDAERLPAPWRVTRKLRLVE